VPGARERALAHLHRLLRPDGRLYLGHAESGVASTARLDIPDDRFPFAFRFPDRANRPEMNEPLSPLTVSRSGEFFKFPFQPMVTEPSRPVAAPPSADPSPIVPASPPAIAKPERATAKSAPRPPARRRPSNNKRPVPAAPVDDRRQPHSSDVDLLTRARDAANAGRLDEAAQHCQRLLNESSPLADAYCLLGIIRQAQGDVAAAEPFFQKAVYLDPSHHESLVHLSLLSQRKGDSQAAANFRRRADRAAKGGD
jgi:chemotaxis protein methyltransferase WspC